MNIKLNGDTYELENDRTIEDLVHELGRDIDGLAVAINDDVVPKSEWSDYVIEADDHVEVIQAVQGG